MQSEEGNNGAVTVHEEGEGEGEEEEEEYVILDLDDVFHGAPVPANCSYTLSGLDTLAPILTLGDSLKLIGEYVETVGSVLVYSEKEEAKPEEESNPGDFPTPIDVNAVGKEEKSLKKIEGVCKLERRLKFRIMQT